MCFALPNVLQHIADNFRAIFVLQCGVNFLVFDGVQSSLGGDFWVRGSNWVEFLE